MKLKLNFFKKLLFAFFCLGLFANSWGQNTYSLITSNSDLTAGGKYLIVGVNSGSYYAMGEQTTSNRPASLITVASGSTTVTVATSSTDTGKPYEITLNGSTGAWNLYDAVNNQYLKPKTGANNGLVGQSGTTNANWAISIAATGVATMTCENTTTYPRNVLRYNTTSTLMACYASGQSDVYLYKLTSGSPTITTNLSTLTGFTYLQGNGPSTSQTFTVGGSNLTNDITLTPPTDYEISTSSSSGFVGNPSTLTLTQSSGTVAATTIYVRLKTGLSAGSYNSETINITSSGATSKTVTCSGTVTAPTPVLIVKNSSASTIPSGSTASTGYNTVFAAQTIGNSGTKTYTLDNTTGTGDLTVTEITSTTGDFTISGITFPTTINAGASTTFVITFSPLATGTRDATISIANNSATNPYTFAVQGTGNCPSAANTLTPNSGPVGTEVTITATSGTLSGVTSVTFNGVAASSFTQVSATIVKAIVPVGATSGSVVTTNSYGCTASTAFSVISSVASSCQGSGAGAGSLSDLFISQFTDTNTGSMSYIELYNGTASTINLTNYSLKFYNNGSATVSNTLALTGSVVAGSTRVIAVGVASSAPWGDCSNANDQYNGTLAQQINTGIGGVNFNASTDNTLGHDFVALYNGATQIDSWGVYGDQSWATSLNLGGKGVNFSRKNTATLPSTTYSNSDWTINDWTTCADEDYSDIGVYSLSTANPPSIVTQPTVTDNCGNVSFSVTASEGFTGAGNTQFLAYQWYENAPGSTSWTALSNGGIYSGVDTATLVLTPGDSKVGYQYYCQVKEDTATCYKASQAVLISSTPLPELVANVSSNAAVICSNSDAVFTITGTTDAVVTYNINSGTNTTVTLTGGTATVTISGVTNSQTINLISITKNSCTKTLSNTVTVTTGATTTWTGSAWDNGAPDATKTAIIAAAYSESTDITACSLTVTNNAVATIPTGYDVFLSKGLTVDSGSTFDLNSDSNLVQATGTTNLNSGSGTVNVYRKTLPLMRLDYVMWGSPVAGQKLQAFSPQTLANRFYTYDPSIVLNATVTNPYVVVAAPSTTNFADAAGYLIRMPNNHPTAATVWEGKFTGVPHSGNYTFTLGNYGANQRFNSIANPYPSTITISDFVSANSSNITGTLYFWRKTNNTNTTPGYCTWAGGTFTTNYEPGAINPGGVLEVGQGFIVEATASGSSVSFTNAMRVGNNGSHLLKTTAIDYNRIWLNMTSPANEFSQMAVGYITGATNGVDMFDGKHFNDGTIALNMKIDNVPYVIQGKALPFADTDVVPLNYKVTNAGNYTIAIDHVDGLFTGGTQDIFIKDNLNNTYTNLNNGSYTFATDAGTFDNRLELVYRSSALSNNNQVVKDIVVFKQNDQIVVEAGNIEINKVEVYDLRGRLLITKKDVNTTSTKLQSVAQNQVLIVKVTATDNTTFVKKIMN